MAATDACYDSALKLNEDPRALLRKFLCVGLICLLVLLLLATYGIYRVYSWRLIDSSHAEAKAICQVLLVKEKKHLLTIDKDGQARLELPPGKQAALEKRLQKYFQPFNVDTVRIWNLQHQIINRSESDRPLSAPPIAHALDMALNGQSISLLGKDSDGSVREKSFWSSADQVVSYLPVWGRNKETLGAIEIRRSVGTYSTEIRRGVTCFILFLGSALLALFGCIYLLVKKGANRLAKTRQVLRLLATTDPLTGVYNRREILVRAEEVFSQRQEKPHRKEPVNFGLLMLDFDNFKDINDNYGHPVGDRVLKELAIRIRAALRPYDVVGRVGGEEFLVVLPDSSLQQCQEIAERLRKTVRERPFEFDQLQIFGSISIGGATAHPLDRDLQALLQRADERLYQAKTRGKDCASWADEVMHSGDFSNRTDPCHLAG